MSSPSKKKAALHRSMKRQSRLRKYQVGVCNFAIYFQPRERTERIIANFNSYQDAMTFAKLYNNHYGDRIFVRNEELGESHRIYVETNSDILFRLSLEADFRYRHDLKKLWREKTSRVDWKKEGF